MAEYYLDENGKLVKVKKRATFQVELDGSITQLEKELDEELAPTKPIEPVKKEEKERTWFQSGALGEGWSWENLGKTILGTYTDIGEHIASGAMRIGETAVDAFAMLGQAQSNQILGESMQSAMALSVLTGQDAGEVYNTYTSLQEESKKSTTEFVAKDLYDEEKIAQDLITKNVKNTTGVDAEIDSVLGEKSDSLVQSAGQLAGTVILTKLGVPWWLTTGATAMGSESEAALKSGATYEEAALSGLISAGAEILTEKISGGISFGGKTLDAGLDALLARNISNKTVRTLVKLGIDATGEGGEEILSGVLSAIGQKLTYEDGKKLFGEDGLFSTEEALESFIGGFVLGGGSSTISSVKSNIKGIDPVTGFNKSESKVFEKEAEKRIAEAEKNGEKLTAREKSKIRQDVMTEMGKGYISTDSIEEALGGDTYKSYRDTVKSEESLIEQEKTLRDEFNKLGKKSNPTLAEQSRYNALERQLADLTSQIETNKKGEQRNALKTKLSEEVKNAVRGTRLAESYNEIERKRQAFTADVSKYKGLAQQSIQSIIDKGQMHNTNRAHDFIDFAVNVSAARGKMVTTTTTAEILAKAEAKHGREYVIENFVKLDENGNPMTYVDKNGKEQWVLKSTPNAEIDGDTIALNVDSPALASWVIGHEIGHTFENTKYYKILADLLNSYDQKVKGNEAYSKQKAATEQRYKKVAGADAQVELNNDLLGEYIFSDEAFVEHLLQDRNIFQRIYDQIKYMLKYATTGSQQERDLLRIKHTFEKMWREGGKAQKNTAENSGIQYSLSGINKDGIEVYETSNEVTELTWPERKAKYLDVMRNEYNGRTAKFQRNGHFYYAEFDGRSVRKPIYGDNRASPNGVKALIKAGADGDVFDLVENSKYRRSKPNTKEHTDADYFDYFVKTVQIDGKVFDLVADVEKKYGVDGGYVYTLALTDNKKIKASPAQGTPKMEPVKNAGNASGEIIPQNSEKSSGEVKNSLSSDPSAEDISVTESGTVSKYSLSTWTPETQERVKSDLVKSGFDEAQATQWVEDTNGIAAVIAANKDRLDFEAADNQTMLKNNQEYVKTLDASTLCAKRLAYQGTFDAIQHRLPNTVLTSDDLIHLSNMLKKHGVEAPCAVCYVESRRRHLGKFAQEWLDGYDGEYVPNLDEVTTSDGLENLRKTHPEAYKSFVDAMNKKGSANPKVVQLRTEYRNEIMSLTPAQIRKIESIGGLRVQSFSDFETPHLLDMMQAVLDMSAKGLTSQAYTKVPNFAWVFGDTGIKINLSLIAEGNGFDSNGNLAFSSVEGMDINEAMRLRNAYSKNVGTIIVGANDQHILASMADDRIDFIIPFHRSGWGQNELTMMGMDSYSDYTYGQNEHDLETGKTVQNLYPPDYWDYNISGKANAERYLNLCAKLGREPKFSNFLVDNGDGSYSLQPDGSTDGYWKMLIDFKMYDNDGNGAAQQKVKPNFNMTEAYRVLEEYEGGANTLPVAQDVVEEFVNSKKNGDFSLSGTDAKIAPTNRGTALRDLRLETAQEDIAPVVETAPETVARNTVRTDEYAPITEEEATLRDADIPLPGEADAPPEMAAPFYGEEGEQATPADPFENRDIKEVGDRKVKAYMFENPEVKSFFQSEANVMLGELRDTIKGEKFYTETETGSFWTGTSRYTSDDIAYLRDALKLSYADIEKGLNAIIEDNGKENIAAAKRIEFILSDRLSKGYTDLTTGMKIPPNEEYLNVLREKEAIEYSAEAGQSIFENADMYAPPVEEDVPAVEEAATEEAPVAENIAPLQENATIEEDEIKPIKTVKERLTAKLQSFQTELENNRQLREDSLNSYDEEIARLQAEYDSRKNKNTKAANDLLRRIERTRRFRDSVDADYAKRISDLEARTADIAEELRTGTSTTEQAAMRQELYQSIIDDTKTAFAERGFDFDEVLEKAKDLSTFATVDNTPQRVMEKSLGYKEGQILSDITVNKVAQNESAGIRWLNSFTDKKNGRLAQISKEYNIKPESKKSAAAQMYAEGFYVDEADNIIAYGDAELAKDFPNAQDQANIKGLAKDPRIREIYDSALQDINESRVRNGYPEIQRLDNFFLHFRAMADTFSRLGLPFNPNDIRAKDLPTDLNGVTADLKPGQPYFSSAMHRKGKRTSFDLLGGLEKYLVSAKNQIYHIDDIQTLRALRNYIAETYGQAKGLENLDALSDEDAEARIKEVYGAHLSTFAKFLNEEANVLAGKTSLIDRGLEGVIGRRGIVFIDTLNRQVGANMVGFNISSAATNFISVAQAMAKTSKADFIRAFAQTASNKVTSIFGKSDGFAESSSVIVRRKGAESFHRTPWQKAGDAGYVLMSAVDNISTELIARTKYNELTRSGMDAEQAHIETDKWVSRLMGDRSLGQQPQLYNSKMLGLVTKFQLEVRNQLDSQFYDTIQEAKVATEDIENALARNAKKAAKITSTFVQLAVLQHVFGKAFESVAGYNPAFDIIDVIIKTLGLDDEEDDEDTVLDNIEEGFLALLGDLPYTSTLTGGRIPIESALPIEQLVTGKDKYGNEKSRWETLGEAVPYYLLPGGYGQIKKTTQGLSMFDEDHPIAGSYTDSGNLRFPVEDTLANRVQAGIFGQWASENARDYFDNERKPLETKQIEEFMSSGMNIQDYWEYREGLSEYDKLAEKADYINGLDLPDETKNLLINNIANRKEPIDMTDYDSYSSFEEFDYATKNPEKYDFLIENNISYDEYKSFDDETKDAYNWAYENPESYTLSKAVSDDVVEYRRYVKALNDITADKDEDGDSISGSRKTKVIEYINTLNADYGAKLILFKSEYKADDTYNYEIVEYLNNRKDISYSEMETILTKLGFTVSPDGDITW